MRKGSEVLGRALQTCGIVAVSALAVCGEAFAADHPLPQIDVGPVVSFSKCRTSNYCGRLLLTNENVYGEMAFVVSNPKGDKGDTAWTLTTPRFAVSAGREYALHLRAAGDFKLSGALPPSHIGWFASDGQPLKTMDALNHEIPLTTVLVVDSGTDRWRNTLKRGRAPAGAAFAEVQFGADYPNLLPGQRFCLSRVAYYERREGVGWEFEDMDPPDLVLQTKSPSSDLASEVVFRLTDASKLNTADFRCRIDDHDVTSLVACQGNVFRYRPSEPWKAGSFHVIAVDCSDAYGNSATRYAFLSFDTASPAHPRATLRDDGMVLLGGKPTFPIGIYSVRKCKLNGGNLDKAVAELKAGGVSLIGTYLTHAGETAADYRELMEACDRHGVQFWAQPAGTHSEGGFKAIFESVSEGLRHPSAFMWENGDDTAFNRTAEELRMDNDACHAVDPFALTAQADISPDEDRVTPYAKHADVFKSENYPIRKETPQPGEFAEMSRDLFRAAGDLRRGGANPPCLFSIVQSFVGWGWHRYPTREELRGMSYLAIACGVRGLTYYTYHSDNGQGVSSTPERFRAFTELTREISALIPHLVTRDAARQPRFEVVSGAKTAAYGRPAVEMLLKESGLFVAVNVTDGPLEVRFTMPDGSTFLHCFPRCGVSLRGVK